MGGPSHCRSAAARRLNAAVATVLTLAALPASAAFAQLRERPPVSFDIPSGNNVEPKTGIGLATKIVLPPSVVPVETTGAPRLEKSENTHTKEAVAAFAANKHGEALRLAQLGAAEGDPQAATLAGYLLIASPQIPANPELAAKWFRQAGEKGQVDALISLGRLGRQKRGGVGPDEARQSYETAIQKGRADAAIELGEALGLGSFGPADLAQSAQNFERAANLGEARGAYLAALLYSDGAGIPVNLVKARALLRLAAEKGVSESYADLGLFLIQGRGGPVDLPEAAKWLQAGAHVDDKDAQYLLAVMLASGKGVATDRIAAYHWVRKAEPAGGSEPSQFEDQRKKLQSALEGVLTAPERQAALKFGASQAESAGSVKTN